MTTRKKITAGAIIAACIGAAFAAGAPGLLIALAMPALVILRL